MIDPSQARPLDPKCGFEKLTTIYGVNVNAYRADNGIFVEQDRRDHISNYGQLVVFVVRMYIIRISNDSKINILIWSFKRKRTLYNTMSNDKARYFKLSQLKYESMISQEYIL